jgi:hypothetical protein
VVCFAQQRVSMETKALSAGESGRLASRAMWKHG